MTAVAPRTWASTRADRGFYCAMALALIVLTGAGFTPTFFARGAFAGSTPLPTPVLVHGVAGTIWVFLFAAQAALVAVRRLEWHRRLGWAGAAAGAVFVASGIAVMAGLESAHGDEPLRWRAPHVFTNGAPLAAFALLVGAAIWQRHVAARHKRLMLLAAVVLLPPAIGRLFARLDLTDFNFAVYAALAYANALYDWLAYGRPHAVSLLGATALVAIDATTIAWLAAVGS